MVAWERAFYFRLRKTNKSGASRLLLVVASVPPATSAAHASAHPSALCDILRLLSAFISTRWSLSRLCMGLQVPAQRQAVSRRRPHLGEPARRRSLAIARLFAQTTAMRLKDTNRDGRVPASCVSFQFPSLCTLSHAWTSGFSYDSQPPVSMAKMIMSRHVRSCSVQPCQPALTVAQTFRRPAPKIALPPPPPRAVIPPPPRRTRSLSPPRQQRAQSSPRQPPSTMV